jgi:hypothetical protein
MGGGGVKILKEIDIIKINFIFCVSFTVQCSYI